MKKLNFLSLLLNIFSTFIVSSDPFKIEHISLELLSNGNLFIFIENFVSICFIKEAYRP